MSAEPESQLIAAATNLYALLGDDWNGAICAADGRTIAELRVVNPEIARSTDASLPLIGTLCTWRNDNADRFLDSSSVTPESTQRWLLALTESPDRLLFLAYGNDGRPLAQYGIRRLNPDIVELDNGILGVRGESPDLFLRIQLRILKLCRTQLGFTEARARVLVDNIPALFLHRRCGLKTLEIFKGQGPGERDVALLGVRLTDTDTD